jgi:ferric-dicitrate binding protein FerR (iron transport regulator)
MDISNNNIEQLIKVLANEASEAERLAVKDWQASSDENQKEYEAFVKLWNLSERAKDVADIDVQAEWQILDKTISVKKGKTIYLNRIWQMAAAIVVLFGLGIIMMNRLQKVTTQSPIAETQTIQLPDGSEVTLNAGTAFTYSKSFGTKNRQVSLKGEAFFKVAKNAEMPFIIDANGASIKVVGTEFNVKAYSHQDEVKVTVVEGVVQLYESKEPTKKTVLNAGETGVYNRKQKEVAKLAETSTNDISWKTQQMHFESTRIGEVVEVLQNVYHVKMEASVKVKNCEVTVTFDHNDLASVLHVLKSTLDLTITQKDKIIFIDGQGCENSGNGSSK